MHSRAAGFLLWSVVTAACGGPAATPKPVAPRPAAEDGQDVCQRVAERVADRFVVAAAARFTKDYPDTPAPSPKDVLATDQRAMFVTVVFDSCFAEWTPPGRSCFLDAAADAPIETCRRAVGHERLAAAIRRAATLLHAIAG